MRVIVESPFRGGWKNVLYSRRCVMDSLSRGESPYASHLLYAQRGMLDDKDQDQRMRGIEAANVWLEVCDFIAVYGDLGVSTGMLFGIVKAAHLNKPIHLRWIDEKRQEVIVE
jgi:hypothetical protein